MLKHVIRTACERERKPLTRRMSISLMHLRRGSDFGMDKLGESHTLSRAEARLRRGRLQSISWPSGESVEDVRKTIKIFFLRKNF